MLSLHNARNRATLYAIETGNGVNLATIQATQVAEGFTPCFGRAEAHCASTQCAFHEPCMNLQAFSCTPAPSNDDTRDFASWSLPAETLLPSGVVETPITPDVDAFNRPAHQRYEAYAD